MKYKAIAYLRKELYKAKANLDFALQRPNVKYDEISALREKINALEWLIESIGSDASEDSSNA